MTFTTHCLPLMELQLPAWSEDWLTPASYGLAAFAALWIAAGMYSMWIRRSYNLQRAESAKTPGLGKPAFLQPDHEARQAAIERGDAYAEERAAEAAAAEAGAASTEPRFVSWLTNLARTGSVVASVVNVSVGIAAAVVLYTTSGTDNTQLSDCWEPLLNRYWIGLAASLCLIAFETWRWTTRAAKTAG